MKSTLYFLVFCVLVCSGCEKVEPEFPVEPQIYYQSTIPHSLDLFGPVENVEVIFRFTDGDGDIALDPSETEPAIYLRRTRDSLLDPFTFPMPYIPKNIRPENESVEGRVVLQLSKAYFSLDSLHTALGGDTISFDIYIQDQAGNRSNQITSEPVIVTF